MLLLLELLVAASGRNTFKVVPFFAVLVFVENCSRGITSTAHFAISTFPFFKVITENALEGRKAPVVVVFFAVIFPLELTLTTFGLLDIHVSLPGSLLIFDAGCVVLNCKECAVDYYLTLSNPAAYLKGLSKDNRPVIVQLVFAADLVNAVACDFDLEEIKAEALREMESDEKSQLEDEAMNESVMAMINEGTPMDENYFLNQNHVEEPSNKHRIRSTEHTDLSNVRRSELDLDKTGIRGKE